MQSNGLSYTKLQTPYTLWIWQHTHTQIYPTCNDDHLSLQMHKERSSILEPPRCLDKAAMVWQLESKGGIAAQRLICVDSDFASEVVNPWKLCTITQVEEVKLFVRIIPIWLSIILYGLIVILTQTFFVEQAATMDRNVGSFFLIPSGSLLSFTSIAVMVFVPIYDRVFVPCARWFTGHDRGVTLLQRLGAGLFLSIVCMVIAALVERRRLEVAIEYGLLDDQSATIPMSVFWLVPQYLLCGVADVFALVGEQEFFYDQVPDSMRSLGISFYLCANGLASYLGSAFISIVGAVTSGGGNGGWIVNNLNRSHLDYYYWLLAVVFTLNFIVFLVLSWCYTYKEVVHSERLYK